MNGLELKQMNMDELFNLRMEKKELLEGYLSDIESKNFLKSSFEERGLIDAKNNVEHDILQIDKEMQSRQ